MIKLIASDLDGTLLIPHRGLPEETFDLINNLYDKGVLFCPASGRQLPSVMQMFAPVLDKIAIIAENGGLVWYKGEVVYRNATSPDEVRYALAIIRQEADLYPLLSTENCGYYESDHQPFIDVCEASYPSLQQVKNLDDVIDGVTTLKISVWDPLLSPLHGGKILPDKIQGLRTMVSGRDWLDVCVQDAHKGNALKALMDYLGVTPEECMAFGDHMNDREMLEACAHPYVTGNGFATLKELFPHAVIGTCSEKSVIKKCKELL